MKYRVVIHGFGDATWGVAEVFRKGAWRAIYTSAVGRATEERQS